MRRSFALYRRELLSFLVSPLAWVLFTVFLLIQGGHFWMLVNYFASQPGVGGEQTPTQAFFGNTVLLYLVLFLLVPPMTMRLFSEERRSGSIELLLTTPVTPRAVVLSKYLSALTIFVLMWLPTTLYLLILSPTGAVDWQAAAASYCGVFLLGAALLGAGTLMSALTRSPFIALILTALVLLALFLIGVAEFVAKPGTLPHDIAAHVSIWAQMGDFSSGIIDTRRVAFDLSLVAFSLFATEKVVDQWRWE
ncbi:MAG: ABC transporter permease subunit [Polyangiaceae bacterium]|nr:ABC transporter permease subunit [Polyangiaceae bacterium]